MITQHNQRVFYSDNGVLQDITLKVNPFREYSFDIGGYVAGEDYIYIGSDLPFSQKFIDIITPNTNSAAINVELWDGNSWQQVVDILDETANGVVSFAKDGIVSWKTKKNEPGWSNESESSDIPELSTTVIYCFYWLRIEFDADLSSGTTINHVGYKFSDDDQLYSQYPDLKNTQMLDCFEPTEPSGTKLDWDEQSLVAAQQLTNQMRTSGITWSPAQIVDFEILQEASVHKTAEIIYSAMGTAYEDNRKLAQEKFSKAFSMKKFNIDRNQNARLDEGERIVSTAFLSR